MKEARLECKTIALKDVLSCFSEMEYKAFVVLLSKAFKHLKKSDGHSSAFLHTLSSNVFKTHNGELESLQNSLIMKLSQEPFKGDRELLKNTLEHIMLGIAAVERDGIPEPDIN